ncbi:hypothetical protein [Streptomyces sp. DHE17-7]|uniref:hypothetical protein n=1 Tax=Streptomyces sp. DHE17-7 TaxID=2759949 RepID=UPI0022EB89F5|nr:hypothetical protein [Streptomyces sp. DHE17-7]MBJ6623518.1 hypothetical protein [Streptomyces sp. DHE17-7]
MPDLTHILDAGLEWLYETVQPDNAHQQHHGITIGHPEANRLYGFCPTGADNLPVVVVNVAKPELHPYDLPANPLRPDELFDLATALEAHGLTVRTTWNGHPAITGSVGLVQPAHPTLIAAVDRYHRGCTVHPERSVFCDCEHWREEGRRIVGPNRPTATP